MIDVKSGALVANKVANIFNPRAVRPFLLSSALCLVGLLYSNESQAQTLREAVLSASQNDPGIEALRSEVARREVGIEAARDERLPTISLSANAGRDRSDGRGITLSVSQVLYDWGRVTSLIETADQDRLIAVADMKSGTERLTLDVAGYYLDIEIYDQKIAQTQNYLAFAQRILGHAEARATAGRGDRGEVARAQLEVIRTQERLDQFASDRSLAVAQLEFLTSLKINKPARPNDLDFAAAYSDASRLNAALRLSPEYLIADASVNRADAQIRLAEAERMPSVRLVGELGRDLGRNDTRSSIGISTGADIGMGAIRGRQVQSAKLQADSARANLAAIGRNLTNGVRSSLERIRALRASEVSQQAQLGQAVEVLDNYEQQFIVGQRQLIDLLTTGRDMFDAEMDLIDTYEQRKRTEYEAAFDLGVLGTMINSSSRD